MVSVGDGRALQHDTDYVSKSIMPVRLHWSAAWQGVGGLDQEMFLLGYVALKC